MIIGHNFNSNHRCKKMIITLISKVISKGLLEELYVAQMGRMEI
jgi:hypothetical protein